MEAVTKSSFEFRRWLKLLVIGLWWLAPSFAVPLLPLLLVLANWFTSSSTLEVVYVGILAGQLTSVIAIAGVAGILWWRGMTLAFGCVLAMYGAFFLGSSLGFRDPVSPEPWYALMAPWLILFGSLPLLTLRFTLRWGLRRPHRTADRPPLQLVDLVAFTALVAAALVLARLYQVVADIPARQFWRANLFWGLLLSSATGLLSVPLTWLILGERKRKWAAILLTLMCAVYSAFSSLLLGEFSREAIWLCSQGVMSAVLSGTFNLVALRWAGLRLVRMPLPDRPSESPSPETRGYRKLLASPWVFVATTVLVAVVANVIAIRIDTNRKQVIAAQTELETWAESLKGSITWSFRKDVILSIGLGPAANSDDLARLAGLSRWPLWSLSLSDTQINDEGMRELARFTELERIYIKSSLITDTGFAHLRHLTRLKEAGLSRTRITGAGLRSLPVSVSELNLSDTAITDADVQQLSHLSLDWLNLARTSITDASLASLTRLRLGRLNIGGTKCTATGLLRCDWTTVRELEIARGQFTKDEVAALRQVVSVVDGNPFSTPEDDSEGRPGSPAEPPTYP